MVEEQERTRLELEKEIEEAYNAIHQLSAALGKSPPELGLFSDMSLKQMLRNYQVQAGKLEREKGEVMRLLKGEWNTLQALWNELGTPRDPQEFGGGEINSFDPSGEFSCIDETKLGAKTLQRYRLLVQHWTAERDSRSRTVADVTQLIDQLEEQLGETSETRKTFPSSWAPCGFERIRALQKHFEQLAAMRDERGKIMAERRKELTKLYDLLETPPAERLESGSEGKLTRSLLDGLENELSRVRLLKAARMRELVERATSELRSLYDEMGVDETRMSELVSGGYTEETLMRIQEETRTMERVVASCRQITELVPRREELRRLHAEVEERQQDPSRLLSKKGGRSLLEEQKMEARVKRELPALESHILKLIAVWEAQNGRPFMWKGVRYADVICSDQAEDARAVEERKERYAARKMRDKDQSAVFERSVVLPAPVVSAKVEARLAQSFAVAPPNIPSRPREVQSARPAARTVSRALATPTNVASRTPSVSVSRHAPTSVSSAPRSLKSRSVEQPDTTPVGAKKYSKVRSKIDTGLRAGKSTAAALSSNDDNSENALRSVANQMKL